MSEARRCVIGESTHPELSKWCRLGLWRALVVIYVNIANGKDPCWSFYKQANDVGLESDAARLLPALLREGLIARGSDGKYIALYDSIDCPELHYKQDEDGVISSHPVIDSFVMNEILSSRMAKTSYYYGVRVSRRAYLAAIETMRQALRDFAKDDVFGEGDTPCDVEIFLTFACVPDKRIITEAQLPIDTTDEALPPLST